ncbi:MAG: prepilin-type N-terminal cleavage/methylation domain-containing protein [Nitrospirae bacterium]|nr:prepilin-type N-terminal cleavage/methylation domain-containing protein [Nitrospirota bacterium]
MQATSALQNNKGLSLIEVIVSLLIMTVMLLGLCQTIVVSISTNMQNVFRNEAVNVAEARMNGVLIDTLGTAHDGLRNIPYANIPAAAGAFNVTRTFRGSAAMTYTVTTIATSITDVVTSTISAYQITVSITWSYKGLTYTHSTMTVIRSIS